MVYWENCIYFQDIIRSLLVLQIVFHFHYKAVVFAYEIFLFFSVLCGHSVFSSRHNSQWPPTSRISIPDLLILILEKEPVLPFSMLSAKQGNYWYHFITSLVWRGPWLGIEPGTSRTRCQHSTTRLSRRRSLKSWFFCQLHYGPITRWFNHKLLSHVYVTDMTSSLMLYSRQIKQLVNINVSARMISVCINGA